MPRKRIVLGSSHFPELASPDVLYIDKSLLIKKIIDDDSKAILLTRPRRWGKTLNMSMLQHFFAPRAYGQETRGLFDHLKIAQKDGGKYMAYQGQYPVIFITLKDTAAESFEAIYKRISLQVTMLFNQHKELCSSSRLSPFMMAQYKMILEGKANQEQIEGSFLILSQCLCEHYQHKVYILIDEYDKPLNYAYKEKYFKKLATFMRNFLSAGLKDNPYLEKGIMTGILRIAKADILSGLNNLAEQTLLDEKYGPYFGFTEAEIIKNLINPDSGGGSPFIKSSLSEMQEWYNGYKIGDLTIYNPWSIIRYLSEDCQIGAYWIGSGERNQLISDILTQASPAIKQQLDQLIQNATIEVILDKFTTFDQLTTEATAFWSLLFNTGYLTIEQRPKKHSMANLHICQVRIPNREIADFYIGTVKRFKQQPELTQNYNRFITSLITGDVDIFEQELKQFLANSFSFFDVGGKNPERVYHAFMLGLIADIREIYLVQSNRESGEGRYDVLLLPKDKSALGIIFEFKSIDPASTPAMLAKSAQDALAQIFNSRYESELEKHKIFNKLFVAIAFAGKKLELRHRINLIPDFDPDHHLSAYRSSQDLFTWNSLPPSLPTLTQPSFGYKVFGEVVGVEKTVTGCFDGEELSFDVYRTGGCGHCGFYSLPIPYDRAGVVELLLRNSGNPRIRQLVMPEIIEALKSGHLPRVMLDGYPQFTEFAAYQSAIDQEQTTILKSVLDLIDPNRNLIPDRQFEKVMGYLRTLDNPIAKTQLQHMTKFQEQYYSKLNEFKVFCQSEEIFSSFIEHYIGGTGELSFTVGGINFARETSFLDAVLEVIEPPIRLYIWESRPTLTNPNRVEIVYEGDERHAPPTHIYHRQGRETHFALMSEGQKHTEQQTMKKRKATGDPPQLRRTKQTRISDFFKKMEKPSDSSSSTNMDLDFSNDGEVHTP